jgi:hypothetical protein
LKTVALIAACPLALCATVPEGWLMAGSAPTYYESAVDSQTVYNGRPSAYLKRISQTETKSGEFGTLMQHFSAKQYNGQRVRFSAYVKSDGVEGWAGLWMRVDKESNAGPRMVSFDNMSDRPINGTSGWQFYDIVLDVPEGSTLIALGILVHGKGTVWLNSANLEIVPKSVPLTGNRPHDRPVNLNFDQ